MIVFSVDSNEKPLYQNRKWLYEQLVIKEKTTKDIANELNCSVSVISKWSGRFDIFPDKSKIKEKYSNEKFLHTELVTNGKSYRQLSREIGCSSSAIRKWAIKYGLDKLRFKYLSDYDNLVLEWDYIKNKNLVMEELTYGSGREVWWKCSKCNHSFKKSVVKRTVRKQGCPKCAGSVVSDRNSLEFNRPDLAIQWDFKKNELTPKEITVKSNIEVWWLCDKCNYNWKTTPNHRSSRDYSSCPNCNGKVLNEFNNLAYVNPQLASEWDYELNDNKPNEVFPYTITKVWWVCNRGHEPYLSSVASRTNGNGCKRCSIGNRSSYPEQALFKYIKMIFPESENLYPIPNGSSNLEVDILIKNLKVVIEYDGYYFHKEKLDKDVEKTKKLNSMNYKVIRVREEGLPNVCGVENISIKFPIKNNLNSTIKKVLESIINFVPNLPDSTVDSVNNLKIQHEEYRFEIEKAVTSVHDKRLNETHPDLVLQWSSRNSFKPNEIKSTSKIPVWWQCKENVNHIWKVSAKSRTSNSSGCPYCSGNKLCIDNSLGVVYPESLEEWHPTKNGDLTPYDISKGSGKEYWFVVKGVERFAKTTQRTAYYKYQRKINSNI